MRPRPLLKLFHILHLIFRDGFWRRGIEEGSRGSLKHPFILIDLMEGGTSSATGYQAACGNLAKGLRECPGGKAG